MGIAVAIVLVLLALLGTPLFTIVGSAAIVLFAFAGIDTQSVAVEMYRLAANPFMLTIPLFTFAGFLMAESGTAGRIARLARAGLGWLPGGLVLAVIGACTFFTTFSGASGVTIIALGGLFLPVLTAEGYPKKFAYGLATTAGSMGLLFPPSLPLLVYGMQSKVDIDKLFIAGLLPGVVTILALSIFGGIVSWRSGAKRTAFNAREFLDAVRETKWELLVPVSIFGGIFGGIVTVAEVAAITAFYLLIVEVYVYKDLQLVRDMPRVIRKSMTLVGAILLILSCALGLTNYLVDAEVPMKIFEVAQTYFTSKWTFLLALNVFLLMVGSILDIFSATFVVVPLIMPVAREVGIDPVHLAIIFIANMQTAYLLPPAGMDLVVSSLAFNQPMTKMYRIALPFGLVMIASLLLITYVPWLSLGLLEFLGK